MLNNAGRTTSVVHEEGLFAMKRTSTKHRCLGRAASAALLIASAASAGCLDDSSTEQADEMNAESRDSALRAMDDPLAKGAERHCVIVIGKAAPTAESPVLSRSCSSDRETALAAVPAAATLLMRWFEHADFNFGGQLTDIFGSAGPCDSDGYRLRAEGFWANRISSFASFSSCNAVTAYDLVNLSGTRESYGNHVPWVGSVMNDRIESFWIRQ